MTPIVTRPCPRDPVFDRPGGVRYRAVVDGLYRVPGQWQVRSNGAMFWLDPMPTPGTIMHAYVDYHTHADDAPRDAGAPARVGWYHALRERVWEAKRAGHATPWLAKLPPVCEQLRFDRAFLDPVSGARLLDVGCGAGELVGRLRRLGWDARGIDPDPCAVAQARTMGRPVEEAGVEALGAMSETFDAITMFHVIEHVFEPMTVLRTMRQRLTPGGRVVIVTPNAGSLCSRLFGRHWRGLEPPRHLQVFTRGALAAALREAGFGEVSVRSSFRDASGMCCASWALWRQGRHTQGATPSRGVRLLGDATLAVEWLLTSIGLPVGEELVAIAERGE